MSDEAAWARRLERERRARKEAEALAERKIGELFDANARLRLSERAIESSVNAIIITRADAAGDPIEYVNPAFERITGYRAEEVRGRHAGFLQGADRDQSGLDEIRAALRERREGHATLRNYRKDGTPFWNDLTIAPVRDGDGAVTHFVGVMNDISEARSYQEQLEHQATHDTLTGLANRNLLRDRVAQALARARRSNELAAVALLDLDQFKVINDSLGHAAGDELLKVVAARLRACVRESDTIARLGGDEFVMLLPDLPDVGAAATVTQRVASTVSAHPHIAEVLQRVLAAAAEPVSLADQQLAITCSIGISVFPHDGTDVDELLKNADAAMYRAKERGRNNFQFYTGELNARVSERLSLQARLRFALERQEFALHYQPIIDLASGRIAAVEALIRWNSPERGTLAPASFIPILEETRMIVDVGWWVLQQAAADWRHWRALGRPWPRVAVNVSQIQLDQDNFAAVVAALGEDAAGLDLEITESMLMHDIERNIPKLAAVRGRGVRVAIDDFGTGYSSLSYLTNLPVDVLKIDLGFVARMVDRREDLAVVSTIITLAHALNLRVVAEGVERPEQLDILRRLRCDEIQGYLVARPMAADALVAWAACRHEVAAAHGGEAS